MEANIYCFICRQNWWILVFAGTNGILSWTSSNILPGCTCCWRQGTGKSDFQVDFQAQRRLEPSLKTDYKLLFFPNFSSVEILNFIFVIKLCLSSFSWPVSRIIFPPCRIKNDNALQLRAYLFECCPLWLGILSEPNPLIFLTHLAWSWTLFQIRISGICTDFTDGETLFSNFTSWFYRYLGKIILPYN